MEIKCNNRTFQIWKYHVSHSMLLVRSPQNKEHKTNIDIIFHGVRFINLPNIFYGMSISPISPEIDKDLLVMIENMQYNPNEVLVFRGDKQKFYVIASGFSVEENEDSIFDVKF